MAMDNPRGYDEEKMKAVNYFIINGWDEKLAYDMVDGFSQKTLNPGEIIVLGALMKLLNAVYHEAAKDKAEKPKISVVSDYPMFKVAMNRVTPLMGRMMIKGDGKIAVEISLTDGETVRPIDWIDFAETNEQLAAYDKFITELIDGTSPYLKLKDGSSYKLSDINYENMEWYMRNIAEV